MLTEVVCAGFFMSAYIGEFTGILGRYCGFESVQYEASGLNVLLMCFEQGLVDLIIKTNPKKQEIKKLILTNFTNIYLSLLLTDIKTVVKNYEYPT